LRPKGVITKAHRKLLVELGVDEKVWAKINAASNHTDGQRIYDEAKEVCRKGYKAAALRYHPDVNQQLSDDERSKKESHFKLLKEAFEVFGESRYQGNSSNTRRASSDFDPFGFQGVADTQMEDDLRYWNDPLMRNFMRMKRQQEQVRRESAASVMEDYAKREFWRSMNLDYDKMKGREAAKPPEKVLTLAGNKGVWYPDRSKWVKTERPKK
jgi:curved DNA-binding protein CbpA